MRLFRFRVVRALGTQIHERRSGRSPHGGLSGGGEWLVVVSGLIALTACAGNETPANARSSGTTTTVAAPSCAKPATCTTRQLADAAGVLFGTAVNLQHLDEPDYQKTLLETFNSITPENDLKWAAIHPKPGVWNFGPVDDLVAFAEKHHLAVKGHNLLWDQAPPSTSTTPKWVLAIKDPQQLRVVIRDHIATLMGRYRGKIDRWDVVNEPLETLGSAVQKNHFWRVLGSDYIAEVFRIAHAADPRAKLFINESTVEFMPAKAAALVALVKGLVARHVPINGVGIQAHLVSGTVDAARLEQLVGDLEALGVEVAITELDVPATAAVGPLQVQARTYAQALGACFVKRCREVTLWGFTDRYTWIDGAFKKGLAPLPFDVNYRPKPALDAIRQRLAAILPSN